MGNEMPNRNIQAGPEEDSMQNQTSQQSSSDGVVVPIEKNMPKSMPLEVPEDDSGSGSKKEAITNKDAMVSKVKTSAIEGDQQVQDKKAEEDTQKSAISHEAAAARVLDGKSIEPQKAVVPAEESIKIQEGSSKNEEVLPNDTEYKCNKDGSTAPPKLEIAAMQVEDKHFDESSKISLAKLKQPCPESEFIISHNQTETDVGSPNHMSVNEKMFPAHMNACESKSEIGAKKDMSRDITDMSSSKAKSEVGAKKDMSRDITGMSSSKAKSEVGAKKDPNLEYNEDKKGVDKVSLQSGTQEPLVMSLPLENIQKMPSPQASGAYEYKCNKDGSTAPPKLEIAAMQVEDKHFDESSKISLAELKQPCPESEFIINDNQTETDVGSPNHMSVNEKMFPAHMNACESKSEIGAKKDMSRDITDMSSSKAKSEVGAKKDMSRDITDMSSSKAKSEVVAKKDMSKDITDMSSSKAKSEVGAKKDPNLEFNEDKKGVDKVSLQSGTQEPLVMSLPLENIQKMPSPQASGAAGAKDIQNIPVMALQILSQQHGFEEKSTEDKIFSSTELCSSNAEPTKIPNGLQPVSEDKQDAHLMHMQQKTMSTEENGLKESVKEPSGDFIILNEIKEEKIGTENQKINSSEVSNGFLNDENIKAKEEKLTSEVEKSESSTVVPSEKIEPEKQGVDITSVEVMEKNVKLQSDLEILEENNSFILHQGKEYKNNTVPEVEIGVFKNPNCLQSKLEPIQDNQGSTETILAVTDAIQESLTLLSPSEHMKNSDTTLLQELKVDASNEEVSPVVEKLEKPAFKQFTDEFLQNDHDKAREMDAANGTMEGTPHLEYIDKRNIVLLVETKDKPSSTSVTVPANEVSPLTEIVVPESSASMYTIEVEGQDFNIQNKETNIATFNFEKKEQALQSQNDCHTEEELNGMTEKDERDVLEPEVNKIDDYKDSLSNSEFTSNQTEEKSNEILQNTSSSIKVDSAQEQEDVSKASHNEMQKQDVNGVDTKNRSAENGMLTILDKEIPTWPATNITSTAGTMDEPPPVIGKEDPIQLGDKSKHTTTSDSELYPSDYMSCPTLESWHEESEDDPKTPLLATAPGSPEEKKESRLQGNLDMDDPKVSLERTDSEKIRTPLHHLFKDDSTVAVSEQIVVPKEQGNAKEKSVEDIWGSPAKLVSTPPSKEKQKTKSIFTQCICCSAEH